MSVKMLCLRSRPKLYDQLVSLITNNKADMISTHQNCNNTICKPDTKRQRETNKSLQSICVIPARFLDGCIQARHIRVHPHALHGAWRSGTIVRLTVTLRAGYRVWICVLCLVRVFLGPSHFAFFGAAPAALTAGNPTAQAPCKRVPAVCQQMMQ